MKSLIVLLIIGIIAYLLFYLKFIMHLRIAWKTLYRKGFKHYASQYGVYCFSGKQGTGKTMSAIRFITNLKLSTNCTIYTNVTSFKLFSDTVFIEDIFQLMDTVVNECDKVFPNRPNIVIFFDEIFTLLTKNDRIQSDVLSFISQLRKRNIIFVTTAQEWLEINLTFRRYIRYNINCNLVGIFGKSYFYNQMQDAENMTYDKDLR